MLCFTLGLRTGRRSHLRRRPFVVAFFVRARDHRSSLQEFLHQILAAATRALFRNRLVSRSELALRIISAPVERIPLAGALLHQVSLFALRTLHADKILLHVLAFGISAARRELAIPSVADHHIASAFRTRLIERNVRNFL